ncbi:major facilitator superfamily transporter [Colletotrichum graminicola M1.001]|uniref:Major facilitator superfamily transporter n=1 Tax=Colletotrichum graminicola (strain M1.001 / M2 / FGSC 10212) TaxID=645133 RepID=E3QTC8_COLGM|nr:major facilitator superfamily transporter [Colletotrichum graminicola M1.001]EFQ34116.1 major facilitator superfamily transporter [Colletotrichum graminicola M1.001]
MDAKSCEINPRNAVSFESLRPIELNPDFNDDKRDVPLNVSASAPPTTSNVRLDEELAEAGLGPEDARDAKLMRRARWALLLLAFFMGDVQDGVGPFLGVYLQHHGWAPGLRGFVNTVSGIATILATGPVGALIDATDYKRSLAAICALLVGVSQGVNLLSTHPALIFSTQIVSAVAGTTLMPLLVALTLGICSPDPVGSLDGKGKHTFRTLNGRNQAANHAGNMVSAGLAAALGSRFGLTAVFWLVMAFCAATIVTVLLLPARAIDHAAARGGVVTVDDAPVSSVQTPDTKDSSRSGTEDEDQAERGGVVSQRKTLIAKLKDKKQRFSVSPVGLVLKNKSLMIVGATVFLFHLGNAAILFLYGQGLVAMGKGDPAGTTGLTVIIAQGTMIAVSLVTPWLAGRYGYWFTVLVSYVVLPVRAAVAGRYIENWGIWPVQILDGVGAGIQSVAIPGLVAVMMAGTGRVNVTFGIVGGVTRQTGAAISSSLGGWMAEDRGYSFSLYFSGVFPLVSVALWLGFYKLLRPVIDRKPGGE